VRGAMVILNNTDENELIRDWWQGECTGASGGLAGLRSGRLAGATPSHHHRQHGPITAAACLEGPWYGMDLTQHQNKKNTTFEITPSSQQ